MKKNNIIYWTTTSLFSVMMLLSASMYFTSPEVQAGFIKMGFHDAFRIELGLAKIIGALVLMIPFFKGSIKEWAYAGFGITLISASILHASIGDPVSKIVAPIIFLGVLAISHIFWKKRLQATA
ncbi:DoxX family protein [Fluviicola sp.]|uniref:DoxX family protein n=1 Tax=Fluviicola sp. TaxID=1917219 RepID=UPI003D2BE8F0